MRNRPYHIYTLSDPINNIVRYIGATIDPEKRLSHHIFGNQGTPQKLGWIKSLNSQGVKPIFTLVSSFNTKEETSVAEIKEYDKNNYGQLFCTDPRANPYNSTYVEFETLHIRFDRELHDKIKVKAKELGLTVPAYIRMTMAEKINTK